MPPVDRYRAKLEQLAQSTVAPRRHRASVTGFACIAILACAAWGISCRNDSEVVPLQDLPTADASSPETAAPVGLGSAPTSCPEGSQFYDRLFVDDEIEATVAFGYIDQHLPTLQGYLRHVLLKLDRIPVFLNSQQMLYDELRERFSQSGYQDQPSAQTDLEFVRPFEYAGRPKTLRVRVVFSIARCPGESLDDEHGRLWRYDDETCPEQQLVTARAKALFATSLAKSHVIVYHGHARRGYGLDFGPMGLDDGKLHLDCSSFGCEASHRSPPQRLVFLSGCDTSDYYGDSLKRLRRALPHSQKLASVTTRGTVFTHSAPQAILRLFDGLLDARCPKELIAALNERRTVTEDVSLVEGDGF